MREPGGFLQVPNRPAHIQARWPGHKGFHISSAKTGSDQLLPLIFVSRLNPPKRFNQADQCPLWHAATVPLGSEGEPEDQELEDPSRVQAYGDKS